MGVEIKDHPDKKVKHFLKIPNPTQPFCTTLGQDTLVEIKGKGHTRLFKNT